MKGNFFPAIDESTFVRNEALKSENTYPSLNMGHFNAYAGGFATQFERSNDYHPTFETSIDNTHFQQPYHDTQINYPVYAMGNHNVSVGCSTLNDSYPFQRNNEAYSKELESFAERFKQRRIKLGVTQAEVGNQLEKLKIPGIGSLSQSTICRFESLTLSHNNMIALKPVLQAWLDWAERDETSSMKPEYSFKNECMKKRKRTSIAAHEKRSLEAYFSVQPRPSGERISQIAEKLELKKNVVRVWFCNQRQKQKRMKFATVQ